MKSVLLFLTALFSSFSTLKAENPEDIFYSNLEKAEAKYRVGMAELIKKADKVFIYLVDFDGVKKLEKDPFAGEVDRAKHILITPYDANTKILNSKLVLGDHRKKLLNTLANQIAKPKHGGGAFCHYPIHGIRIYAGDKLLHEGTFCWVCGNFSFTYPQGSAWLDANAELQKLFTTLLPIPQKELDRFHKKYPGAKPKAKIPKSTP